MKFTAVSVVALAAALAACGPRAPVVPAAEAPVVDPNSPLAAPMYMAMAASGDMLEIQSSQVALQRSANPAVRSFAQMLIADHSRMSQQMMAAASAAGLTPPPPALQPPHAQMLQQLQATPAGSFEMAFQQMQIAAHQEALALHQNYASGGDVPALRAVAASAVPVIQQHLNAIQSMQLMPQAAPPVYQAPATPGERG